MAISLTSMFIIFKVTDYLMDKPKTGKFRKWWSSHIVDLDNKYNDQNINHTSN